MQRRRRAGIAQFDANQHHGGAQVFMQFCEIGFLVVTVTDRAIETRDLLDVAEDFAAVAWPDQRRRLIPQTIQKTATPRAELFGALRQRGLRQQQIEHERRVVETGARGFEAIGEYARRSVVEGMPRGQNFVEPSSGAGLVIDTQHADGNAMRFRRTQRMLESVQNLIDGGVIHRAITIRRIESLAFYALCRINTTRAL